MKPGTKRKAPHRTLVLGLLLTLGSVLANSFPWTARSADEPKSVLLLKAGILTHLPLFIRWPGEDVEGFVGRFTYCVFGASDLEKPLRQVVAYAVVKGGSPRVKRVSDISEIPGCQVLFVPRAEARQLDDILSFTRDQPILTVGDAVEFDRHGVLITLFLDKGKVRFAINRPNLEQSGLSASFRLLESATEINR